jgi:hypothetical protein
VKRVRATTGWRTNREEFGVGSRNRLEPVDIHLGDAPDKAQSEDALRSYCGAPVTVIDDDWHSGVGKCLRCLHHANLADKAAARDRLARTRAAENAAHARA